MKIGSVLSLAAVSAGLVFSPVHGATPDDMYLDAYRLIQEADQISAVQPEQARQNYEQAREDLKKLQTSFPNYSKAAVEFRLEYIQDRLKGLPAPKAQSGGTQQPARPALPARPEEQVKALQEQVTRLESDNALLQEKLKEALAPKPAALDPHEFAKLEERIKQLEKEKELLKASLEQAQAKQPQALDAAQLEQLKAELANTKKQLVENVASVASLTQENQKLKQEIAASKGTAAPAGDAALQQARTTIATLEQEKADWQKQRAELENRLASTGGNEGSKIKSLEKERDSLLKKLNDANKELYDVKARGQAAQLETLTNQLANLRARLEVFEARKVPYTKEELALMDKNVPKLAVTPDNRNTNAKRSPRELPPGAGPLVAAAEAAFAARRYEDAEAKYEQVLKLDEKNPTSLANLAAIQLQLQKQDQAEANLKKALAERPDDAYALSLLGMLRFQQGKYDEAFDALSRSAQLDPKNPETENYLGITLSQQGHREAAETALRKALMLNPNYAGAHHNLAVIYATQKPAFTELAKYHYNKALALGQPPNPDLEKQLNQASNSR